MRNNRFQGDTVSISMQLFKSNNCSYLIKVGDALQIISNGHYKSVKHRVSVNGNSNRISFPIFVCPRPSDIIGPLPEVVQNGEKPLYKHILYSDYVNHFFGKAHVGKATIEFTKGDS
jgi:feruloyl-CoA 6-hydroxylase